MNAEITMIVRHRHFLKLLASYVGFDEEIGPAPVSGAFTICTDALELARTRAFAGGGVKIGLTE